MPLAATPTATRVEIDRIYRGRVQMLDDMGDDFRVDQVLTLKQ